MTDRMLQFFKYDHLPPHLQEYSQPFSQLAHHIVAKLPRNAERSVALRKLLEAKDCAVRAYLEGEVA
jgi:ferritin-like protein